MKKILILTLILIISFNTQSYSQRDISIFQLYDLAIRNHPLSNLDSLYNIQEEYNISTLKKKYLPEMNLSGQLSYQSIVPEINIPVPGLTMPDFPKDHYNLNLDVNQLIFDCGLNETLQEIEKIKFISLKEMINKDIYSVYDNINNAYFGILLIEANVKISLSIKEDLDRKLEIINQGLINEVASQNDYDKLYTEKLKLEESIIKLEYDKKTLLNTIFELTGIELKNPSNPIIESLSIKNYSRVEYKLLDQQNNLFNKQIQLLQQNKLPKVSGFAQAGYGKPGYNFFSDDFSDYYMIGIRFKWNIYDWNISNNKKEALLIDKEIIKNKRSSLDRSLKIAINKTETEIEKFTLQREKAIKIISIKEEILARSDTALQNGIIIVADYIYDLNELGRAKTKLESYNILISQAYLNKLIITGEINSLRENLSSNK